MLCFSCSRAGRNSPWLVLDGGTSICVEPRKPVYDGMVAGGGQCDSARSPCQRTHAACACVSMCLCCAVLCCVTLVWLDATCASKEANGLDGSIQSFHIARPFDSPIYCFIRGADPRGSGKQGGCMFCYSTYMYVLLFYIHLPCWKETALNLVTEDEMG